MPKCRFVYFIRHGSKGPIKIGIAANPTHRLCQMQTSNPERLHILLAVPGSPALEFALHSDFVKAHIHGEWFKPCASLLHLIADWSSNPAAASAYRETRAPGAELTRAEKLMKKQQSEWGKRGSAIARQRRMERVSAVSPWN